MKKNYRIKQYAASLLLAATAGFIACSDDDNPQVKPSEKTYNYILLTGDMTTSPFTGYTTAYEKMPDGKTENVKNGSLALQTNGIRSWGKWIFKRTSLSSEGAKDDVVRYSVDENGHIKESGRLISGTNSNYCIYNETTGFYFDANRGLLKIQKFNPTTMERTGEIGLSAIRNNKYPYQDVGTNVMVAKDGKLFVDIYYNTINEKGNFMKSEALGFVEMAVIDIATSKYEKTIRNNNVSSLGYSGNENQMWTLGSDGALYICSHGFGATGAINGSAIVRIKKGETDFDQKWIIRANDYTNGASLGTVCVHKGKLYTQISTKPLVFQNILKDVMYDYYAFDTENLAAGGMKVSGIPQTTYTFVCAQNIITIDDKVYFRVVNNTDQNGYYVLGANNTATQSFNVSSGGTVWGLLKLTN